ncbi:hypothetical protein SAMN05660485_03174 [Blastococcus fimeti]|nr:hypothetical protein SAMN05660485_03174 [Blastococcus fimeti]
MGTILWELSLAYISAWVFNLLVVVLPKRSDKRDIYRIVEPLMHSAAAWSFLSMLFAVAEEHHIPGRPDREALARACAKMNPNDEARSGVKKDRTGRPVPITWMEYGEQDMQRSAEALRDLQAFYPYLDAEAITLLDEVKNHFARIIFKDAEFLGRSGETNFSKYEKYFYDYWVLTNRLVQYKIERVAPLARGMA